MTKFKLLGAAALVVALASPVMAQDAPRDQTQKHMRMTPHRANQRHTAYRQGNMARKNMAQNRNMTRDNMAYRNDNNGWNNGWNNPAFWPGDIAAGVAGGAAATADAAVNTAGAIAAAPFAPFGGDPYAYYNNGYNNGLVCQPGTWFRGEDGRRHICR
jgi:Ni/Co efflux regulator RcnB